MEEDEFTILDVDTHYGAKQSRVPTGEPFHRVRGAYTSADRTDSEEFER